MKGEESIHPERLLSLREVARRLGIHYQTALKMIHEGELPHRRVGSGRRIRVRESELIAYMKGES